MEHVVVKLLLSTTLHGIIVTPRASMTEAVKLALEELGKLMHELLVMVPAVREKLRKPGADA